MQLTSGEEETKIVGSLVKIEGPQLATMSSSQSPKGPTQAKRLRGRKWAFNVHKPPLVPPLLAIPSGEIDLRLIYFARKLAVGKALARAQKAKI